MRPQTILFVLFLSAAVCPAQNERLAFQPAKSGHFAFDTGVVKGRLRADNASQGLVSFVDTRSGAELDHAPGILSYYRLLSTGKRWGEDFRSWPKSASRLPDGAVEVVWPPHQDHPVELRATYRWKSPDTLDLETVVRPERDMPKLEVFLSSYFSKGFRGEVYVRAPRHRPGKPHFLSLAANPFIVGTYLAFPRDLEAARMIYDGRWESGRNPVQFSVNRFLEAPIAMKRDAGNDITCLMMSRPDDCFAIEAPYDQDRPDGVAAHYSLYFSFFGRDLKSGETARTVTRLVVGRNITEQRAPELYSSFLEETK